MRSLSDKVMACQNLPSLPNVAMEVLELVGSPDVPLTKIAGVVQNDQALAAKILKTVNSSFYALASPCPTIERAMGYMGLNTVKSLVLGFSLVEGLGGPDENAGFDMIAHWRRAVYGATAARLIALKHQQIDPEEAFTAAMLQDIGMLALFRAVEREYLPVLRGAPPAHADLPDHEREHLGTDHTEIGAELAAKWSLPEAFVETIRAHHDPSKCAEEHQVLVRTVALGRMATAALSEDDASVPMDRLEQNALEWFGINAEEMPALLQETASGAAELSRQFQLDIGARPDVGAILDRAERTLVEHQLNMEREAVELAQRNEALKNQSIQDGLTGLRNRRSFDETITAAFEEAESKGEPIAVLFIDGDRFKDINDSQGHQAGDAVLVQIAQRLSDTLKDRGTVFRYGGEEFVVMLPGAGIEQATEVGEQLRACIEHPPIDLSSVECPVNEHTQTVSVGAAATDAGEFHKSEQLVAAADEAVYEAKRTGRNRVCAHRTRTGQRPEEKPVAPAQQTPAPDTNPASTAPAAPDTNPASAAPADGAPASNSSALLRILLVEDDSLHAGLFKTPLSGIKDVEVRHVPSAEEALEVLRGANGQPPYRPSVVLCDLTLPGMQGDELLAQIKGSDTLRSIPIVMLSVNDDTETVERCMSAGASAFISKSRIADQPHRRVLQITQFWSIARAA